MNEGVEASSPASASLVGACRAACARASERKVKFAARKTNCNNFTKNGVIHTFHGCIMF